MQNAQFARFMEKVEVVPDDGCWLWKGRTNEKGYGRYDLPRPARRMVAAHRFSYQLFRGDIPDDLEVDHTCNVRRCVNPEHLETVTHAENIRRIPPSARPRRANCPRGHRMEGRNVYIRPDGTRECWACKRIRHQAYKKRRRASERSELEKGGE